MKRFSEIPDADLLGLTNEQLNDAIRVEAIERGLKIPVTLSEALTQSEYRGYQAPVQAVDVYCLKHGYNTASFGYLDKALAERAMEGMVVVGSDGYGANKRMKIETADIELVLIKVGVSPATSKGARFEEYTQDDKEFNALVDECMARYGEVRQAAYNAKVRSERKIEYLRLANGSEEIAKAFWAKAERTEWPSEKAINQAEA